MRGITKKSPVKKNKKTPPPGRKMSKDEARTYVFKAYRETMTLLAKN
jgi:hypothetical protein